MKPKRAFFSPRFFQPRHQAERLAAGTPDLIAIARRIAAQILIGPHAIRKPGSGESFWQYRDYVQGDMPGQIDWRQSAKTDHVFVREKEQHKAQAHYVWIKRNADMDFSSDERLLTKRQSACVFALALSLLHTRAGGLCAFLGAQKPGHSEHTLQTLESLILMDASPALPEAHNRLPRGADLTLISDFLEPLADIRACLDHFRGQNAHITLLHILDPAEITLPYRGRTIFEAPHGGLSVPIQNAGDVAAAYQDRMAGHISALEGLAAEYGFIYIRHNSADDPAATLHSYWQRLMVHHSGGRA